MARNFSIDIDATVLEAAIRDFGERAEEHFVQGVQTMAESTMTLSKAVFVPVVTGTLRSSGFVTPRLPTPDGYMIDIGFGGAAAAYAAVVHFRPASVGQGRNLYLTKPVTAMARSAETTMAAWMRKRLLPQFVDPEDLDIFKIVDTPKDCAKAVTDGIKKRWWRPLDVDLARVEPTKAERKETPMAGAKSGDTGEGTLYGKRPRRPEKAHARPGRKPPQ